MQALISRIIVHRHRAYIYGPYAQLCVSVVPSCCGMHAALRTEKVHPIGCIGQKELSCLRLGQTPLVSRSRSSERTRMEP